MSYVDERATIETLFAAAWADRTPAGFDGHTFTPSAGSVRLTILNGEGRQASVGSPGSNIARYAGVVSVQVFTEGGKGTAASRIFEDDILEIFRNREAGSLRFGVPYVSGTMEDPPFMIRTIMAPFTRDEFHA